MIFTYAALGLAGVAALWYLFAFNGLVAARNAVDQAWSHIEVELTRRLDLIQNLVEVAKGYAGHERDVFTQVAQLRNRQLMFHTAAQANEVQPELTRTLGHVMALAESYPQLRADQTFLNLQTELRSAEDRIAERRHAYNQTVNLYLNACQTFPSSVVADVHQAPLRSYFDVPDADVAAAPQVELR